MVAPSLLQYLQLTNERRKGNVCFLFLGQISFYLVIHECLHKRVHWSIMFVRHQGKAKLIAGEPFPDSGCTSALLWIQARVDFLLRSATMLIMQVRRNGMVMTVYFTSPAAVIEWSSFGRAEFTSRPICRAVAVSFLSASRASGLSFLHGAHHPSGSTCLADHAIPHWMHSLEHFSSLALTHHPPLVVW